MNHNTGKKGFTLLELMIVIAIMAILAGIAIPSMQPYMAQRRLSGAVRQVHTDLMSMRMQAASENRWIALNVDNSQRYTIFRDNAKTGIKTATGNEILLVRDLQSTYRDVSFSSAADTIVTFYPNGTSATVTLGFASPAGTKTITVSSAGRAKIN